MIILYILLGLLALFIFYVLFLLICSLFVDPKKEYTHDSPFYRFLVDSSTAFWLWFLGIRVHVTGAEKVPPHRAVLFVGNHRSNFDPIVTWYAFKKHRIAFISKPSNFKIPMFGRFIRKCCFMAIDRENPRNAIGTIHKAADLLHRQEVSVGVYPEGKRSKTGQLLPFHNGVFKIAQKADAPIVVIALRGTELIHKQVFRRRSHVYLDVLDVIEPDQVRRTRTDAIGQHVYTALQTHLEEKP